MAAPADPSPPQRVNRIPLAAQAAFSIAFGIYTQIDAVRAERSWAVAGVRHVVVPTGLVTDLAQGLFGQFGAVVFELLIGTGFVILGVLSRFSKVLRVTRYGVGAQGLGRDGLAGC
jgi:hypothetical protein